MIVGLIAVFQYHNHRNKANLWSMHSWFGLLTIVLFLLQVRFQAVSVGMLN